MACRRMASATACTRVAAPSLRLAFSRWKRAVRALMPKITPISAESEYIPTTPMELPEGKADEVLRMIDALEQDDDVQKVFHNLG